MHPQLGKQSLPQSIKSAMRGLAHGCHTRNTVLLLVGALGAQILLAWNRNSIVSEHLVVGLASLVTIALELMNTSIEELSDVLVREHHPGIAKTKEIAAGAVLLMALSTLAITVIMLAS